MKLWNADLRAVKEQERKLLLKEARARLAVVKKGKKGKKMIGTRRPERWPGKCWQCMHKHGGGIGGKAHQVALCRLTKQWLSRPK